MRAGIREVPTYSDYVLKSIGPQPVIMTRDRIGGIHLLLNRCAHRANQVCDAQSGNSSAFRCPYHGWTFGNDGRLLGFPFNSGYGGREAKKEFGLGRVQKPRFRHGSYAFYFVDGDSNWWEIEYRTPELLYTSLRQKGDQVDPQAP